MDLTKSLTGELPLVIVVSTALTALLSIFLLWLYRRSVVQAMNIQSIDNEASQKFAMTSGTRRNNIFPAIKLIETVSNGESNYLRAIQSLNRVVTIYIIGGLFYSLVLTFAWIITADAGFHPILFLWLFSCFSWPIILSVHFIKPSIKKYSTVFYSAIILFIAIIALIRNPNLTIVQLIYLWLLINGPGTILIVVFMNQRVRAVGPLVLVFMVAAITGSIVVVDVVGGNEELMRGFANMGSALSFGAKTIFASFFIIGFIIFGIFGWQLLRWLGHRYKKKRISDQSIILDSLWLLFGIIQSYILVFHGWAWIFAGIVAFSLYKIVVRLSFRYYIQQSADIAKNQRLLLLRVFSLGHRSEQLFEMISKVWLRIGNINLIAGPDLVRSTVEPHEFLNFMGGHLLQQFVSNEKDIEQYISSIDNLPDPDGRYRVNEFFCRANTWQMSMKRLALESDVVLMDLRSFSKKNQGCTYELHQLFNYVSSDRIVFIVDDSTDHFFLKEIINKIYGEIDWELPYLTEKNEQIQLFSYKKKSYPEVERLLMLLFKIQREDTLVQNSALQ